MNSDKQLPKSPLAFVVPVPLPSPSGLDNYGVEVAAYTKATGSDPHSTRGGKAARKRE